MLSSTNCTKTKCEQKILDFHTNEITYSKIPNILYTLVKSCVELQLNSRRVLFFLFVELLVSRRLLTRASSEQYPSLSVYFYKKYAVESVDLPAGKQRVLTTIKKNGKRRERKNVLTLIFLFRFKTWSEIYLRENVTYRTNFIGRKNQIERKKYTRLTVCKLI